MKRKRTLNMMAAHSEPESNIRAGGVLAVGTLPKDTRRDDQREEDKHHRAGHGGEERQEPEPADGGEGPQEPDAGR